MKQSQIMKSLCTEQKRLKTEKKLVQRKIQNLYDRWKRNGVYHNGTTYIPIMAVKPLPRLLRKMSKIDIALNINKKILASAVRLTKPW